MFAAEEHVVDAVRSGAPFVSVVLTGRNDGYGGDFNSRFFRTLGFNHQQLKERGIEHEIVFVEWAPPLGRPLLRDLAYHALPALHSAKVSWYVVAEEYQQALSLNARLQYLEFIAKNVGIRRASGRFVLVSNCDVFLGRRVLETFADSRLLARTVYRAPRFDLSQSLLDQAVDWAALEDPRNLDGPPPRLKPPFMGGATGDFLLLDRVSFHDIRGFNEVYRVARIGIDRNFIVKALSSGLQVADIGGPVYHVNHEGSYRLSRNVYAGREAEAHWGNRRWHARGVVYVNPTSWGLRDAPMSEQSPGCWRLDFSWDAVPPLVDLRRVVVPAARRGRPTPGLYVGRSSRS